MDTFGSNQISDEVFYYSEVPHKGTSFMLIVFLFFKSREKSLKFETWVFRLGKRNCEK